MRSAALAAVLTVAGVGVAQAMSFSTLTSYHDGTARGKGYGRFYGVGYNGASMASTLADLRLDGVRTFADGLGSGYMDTVRVQSGRRTDGENWFATMATKTGYASGSTSGMNAQVKVCQDVNLSPDWCSSTAVGSL